jgi:hypothetical protein
MNNNPCIGSSLDDLLEENGILAEVNALAIKRVLAWYVSQEMRNMGQAISTTDEDRLSSK